MRGYVDPPDVTGHGNIKVSTDQIREEVERMSMGTLMLLCDILDCGYNETDKLTSKLEKIAKKNGNWA